MVVAALLSLAALSAAFNLGAAGVFYVWMRRQSRRLLAATGHSPSPFPGAGPSPRSTSLLPSGEFAPEAVVILCVRGHDPFLADTIRALARQDYPNYRLLVVVDHHSDPAWQIVSGVKSELGLHDGQLEMQELAQRLKRCGLKCSALLQACASLPASTDDPDRVMVTIDSDAVPGARWLSNLIRPLSDPRVGATTSNQWFEPDSRELGSWVRAVWQAGAIVPTAILGNPWAGSFAIRWADLLSSGLRDAWRTSIIDDGPVRACLNRLQKRIEFVPQNLVINREDCDLGFCFRYIGRMLTWSRLFESTFWITGIHAALLFGTLLLLLGWCLSDSVVAALWAAGRSAPPTAGPWAWAALGIWLGGQAVGYAIVRGSVHAQGVVSGGRGRRPQPLIFRVPLLLMAIPLATLAYAVGCLSALRVKQVVWRNIAYEIEAGHRITMVDYTPFTAEAGQRFEHHSI